MASTDAPRLHWGSRARQSEASPSTLSGAVPPEARARLIQGDNLAALRCLEGDPGVRGQVSLAYLDPPFLTGREHFHNKRLAATESGPSAPERTLAFDDRFPTLNAYLDVLEPRLRAVRDLLAPHGSLVLHVDPKTSHYAKVVCDEVFGPESFASEVIWRYRRWPSKTKNFQRVHDVMLRYVKDPESEPRWNQLYEPLAPSTLATWGNSKQRAVTAENGRRVRSSKTDQASLGTPLGDVWDISIVAPVARERTGYPTQKPELLLARWIEALTQPDDLVLDPYVGSGTSIVAALRRGRRVIGIDQGQAAWDVIRSRLSQEGFEHVEQVVSPRLGRGRAGAGAAGAATTGRGLGRLSKTG